MTESVEKIVVKYSNKDLSSFQIYQELEKECLKLQRLNSRNFKELAYMSAAKEVIWFLSKSSKPDLLNGDSLMALKPLAEELIEHGHMDNKAIDIFELDS